MKTMTYKQALSFNRKLRNKEERGEISNDTYWDKKIDIYDFVRNDLTTDQELPAKLLAVFHWRNENGLMSQLPETEDFTKDGRFFQAYFMYAQYHNYHAKKLTKLALQRQPSRWDVDYHTRGLATDLEEYKEWKKEVYDKKQT